MYDEQLAQAWKRIVELEAQLAAEQKKVADLEKPAAFGWQCYQDRCENAYVEQSVVKRLEAALQVAREALENIECGDGQCNCGYGGCNYACKEYARKALARMEEVSRG